MQWAFSNGQVQCITANNQRQKSGRRDRAGNSTADLMQPHSWLTLSCETADLPLFLQLKIEKASLKGKPKDVGEPSLVENGTMWIGSKWHACTKEAVEAMGRPPILVPPPYASHARCRLF